MYSLKKPYDDGTTQISMTQIELLERLASIIPRPRVHLTRFSGVFAPNYKYRSLIVPKPKAPWRRGCGLRKSLIFFNTQWAALPNPTKLYKSLCLWSFQGRVLRLPELRH